MGTAEEPKGERRDEGDAHGGIICGFHGHLQQVVVYNRLATGTSIAVHARTPTDDEKHAHSAAHSLPLSVFYIDRGCCCCTTVP